MSDIIISDEAIRLWEKEIESLERVNRENLAKIELLKRRLAAVHLFRTDYAPIAAESDGPSDDRARLPEKLPDAIRTLLSQDSMRRSVLIHKLREGGFTEERMGKNNAYFYSVVRRFVKNGTIKKRGDLLTKVEKAAGQMV